MSSVLLGRMMMRGEDQFGWVCRLGEVLEKRREKRGCPRDGNGVVVAGGGNRFVPSRVDLHQKAKQGGNRYCSTYSYGTIATGYGDYKSVQGTIAPSPPQEE